ncbi:hypothetical protein [Streptomyces mirabilis]|uniref:hypothetical protein n=1 Tax=Streptomyces mirabilis TaxID=68239 RepID=UPI0033CE51E0
MTHASAQLIGDRSHQCDATATYTHNGARAYVLCDGIGSSDAVRAWTLTAARHADAEAGLRAVYDSYAAEPERSDQYADVPNASAAVAVTAPGKPLAIAWCGDVRAYVFTLSGTLQCLTADHNMRRVFRGSRNLVTSHLGATESDDQRKARYGHPAIETATGPAKACRLLLATARTSPSRTPPAPSPTTSAGAPSRPQRTSSQPPSSTPEATPTTRPSWSPTSP